jgi:hypothetical protein
VNQEAHITVQRFFQGLLSIFPQAVAMGLILSATAAVAAVPLVQFQIEAGSGTTIANTGSITRPGAIMGSKPIWVVNAPINGGTYSLDFGTTSSGSYAVDMTNTSGLNNLKSFTITGWVNCLNSSTGAGGNRIVSWILPNGTQGVDLAFQSDGSLTLGVNQWTDLSNIRSSGGKITVDANASYNNWRFFAVTYNSLAATNQVKFYFGSNTSPASLDVQRTYANGAVGSNPDGTLTLGNLPADHRSYAQSDMFKGKLDQISIYGSAADGSGALTDAELRQIQNAYPLTGQGVLYEEWSGISGTTVESLVMDPSFPGAPSATRVLSSFDAVQNHGDNYGARLSGWIKAPASGSYVFWISSDDHSELRLSSDANPTNKALIASVTGHTDYPDPAKWTIYPATQQSASVTLEAGKFYYIEALFKEGTGNDHVEVGWQLPSGTLERPIPAGRTYLRPDDGDALFPSSISLYSPGSSEKKATLGWESGDNSLYLKTENVQRLKLKNDVATLPAKLTFDEPGDGDVGLGIRVEADAAEGGNQLTYGKDGAGNWAMAMHHHSGAGADLPYMEFNQRLMLSGPPLDADNAAVLDFRSGLTFTEENSGTGQANSSNLNSVSLAFESEYDAGSGLETHSTLMNGGSGIMTNVLQGTSRETKWDENGFSYRTFDGQGDISKTQIDETGVNTDGVVTAREVVTNKWRIPVPDYVFEKSHKIRSLEETERFVNKNKHLPDIPSASEMQEKGMPVGEMNLRLLKSVEELTLHVIELNKELKRQKTRNESLETEIKAIKKAGKGR